MEPANGAAASSEFNEAGFDDVAGAGGDADGLLDFTIGDAGLDDSAFGEAFHGMDA